MEKNVEWKWSEEEPINPCACNSATARDGLRGMKCIYTRNESCEKGLVWVKM